MGTDALEHPAVAAMARARLGMIRAMLARLTVLILLVAVLLQGCAIYNINKTDRAQNSSIRALRR